MKLWGDLDDPRKTLSGEGRALDLLGVRYLLVKNPAREPVSPFKPGEDPRRVVKLDGYLFADDGLSAPAFKHGECLVFNVPRFDTDHFALVSSLAGRFKCLTERQSRAFICMLRMDAYLSSIFAQVSTLLTGRTTARTFRRKFVNDGRR